MKIGRSLEIDVKSIFRKGIKKKVEPFGCFLITGYMGSGKTYLSVYLTLKFNINNTYTIKTNIHSLKIPNMKIEYFSNLFDIYLDTDEYYIYIIDELGKKYPKDCKMDKDFYNFLQMSRKAKRIVLAIHQEYYLIPLWLRGTFEEVFTTTRFKFLPLFITYRGFAKLDEESKEWTVDYNYRYIYKRNKLIGSYYDTFETVGAL